MIRCPARDSCVCPVGVCVQGFGEDDQPSPGEPPFKVAGAETGAVVEEALRSRRPPPRRVMTGDKPRNRGAWDETDAQAATQGGGHDPTDRTVSPGTEVSAALGAIEDVVLAEPAINYPDPTVAMFRARALATAAGLNEFARRKLFPDSPPRDLQAVMRLALADAGLLPSPESLVILSDPRPAEPEPARRRPVTADQPRVSISDLRMGQELHGSDPDPMMLGLIEPLRIDVDGSTGLQSPAATRESDEDYKARIRGYFQERWDGIKGEVHGVPGYGARISLVNAPKWEAVAERARKVGIEPDWSLCGALWLALDKFESAERARKAEFEKWCKAVAREARTGTKLGEARKAIAEQTGRFMAPVDAFGPRFAGEDDEAYVARIQGDLRSLRVWRGWAAKWTTGGDVDARLALDGRLNAAPTAPAGLAWLRDQAADIDGDLPVAELDEVQLRGVVGVELLRLRRELEVARAEPEANNARIGELVAERAALRRELDAARMTNQALAYPGRDDEGRLLKPGHAIEAEDADRWGLNDREYFLFRLGQHGARGADVAGAGVHRLAYLLDVAEGNRRDAEPAAIEAQREALVAANPPPRSPFTPEQERAIGSFLPKVSVLALEPGRWQVYVDGEPWAGLVVQQPDEESAKRLGCIALARMRRPGLWPKGAALPSLLGRESPPQDGIEVRAYHPASRETSFARCPHDAAHPGVVVVPATDDRDSLPAIAIALYQQREGTAERPFVMTGFLVEREPVEPA